MLFCQQISLVAQSSLAVGASDKIVFLNLSHVKVSSKLSQKLGILIGCFDGRPSRDKGTTRPPSLRAPLAKTYLSIDFRSVGRKRTITTFDRTFSVSMLLESTNTITNYPFITYYAEFTGEISQI